MPRSRSGVASALPTTAMISGVGIDFSPRPPEHHDPGRHDVGSDEWHAALVRTASSPASPTLRLARWLAGSTTAMISGVGDLREDPEDLKRLKLRHHRGPQTPN